MLLMSIDFVEIFQNVFQQFGNAIPGIVGAMAVFFIGWLLAGLAGRLVRGLLSKIGVDRFADRVEQVDIFARMKMDMKPSGILSKVVYYLIMLVTMMVASEVSGLQELSDLMNQIINFAPKLLVAFIILVIGLLVADFVKKLVVTACDSVGIPSGRIIANFIFYFIFVTVIITSMEQIGIPTDMISNNITVIIAGLVLAFSVGYGVASRKVMASILSSFFYTKGKVEVGNVIKINGVKGTVIAMDSTSIMLRTEEDTKVLIPLSRFAEEDVEIFP